MMRSFFRLLAITALMSILLTSASFAGNAKATKSIAKTHRVAIQVDQNDPAVMNLALNNAKNILEYYQTKGEPVEVNIVTYGPGLYMLRDSSPVQDRIKQLNKVAFPGKIEFSACNNTKEAMEKREGQSIAILPEARLVPSGVVTLMQLQEEGWSYVRP
jgi:intracellular sulfur oxidation DsrE/DsrF family protein